MFENVLQSLLKILNTAETIGKVMMSLSLINSNVSFSCVCPVIGHGFRHNIV